MNTVILFILLLPGLLCQDARLEPELDGNYTEDGQKLFEGDMVLTEDQRKWMNGEIDSKNAISFLSYRWPGAVIQFRLHGRSVDNRTLILKAINHWMKYTCINFQEVPANYSGHHIIFQQLIGCYSNVGRIPTAINGQNISIGRECEFGNIVHEIGHVIGLHHEQSRPDRDNYVILLPENIFPSALKQFETHQTINNYNIPYDVSSIMHYGIDGFSMNGKNTLVTKDVFRNFHIGQRKGLSFLDKKIVNIMYNCSAHCDKSTKCSNYGYLDKNCRCVYPPGYLDGRCDGRTRNCAVCGGSINWRTKLSSPKLQYKDPKEVTCVWFITAPQKKKVRVKFYSFCMGQRNKTPNCQQNYLEIRNKNLYDGNKFCEKELHGLQMTSYNETMVLLLKTFHSVYYNFRAEIDFIEMEHQ